MPKFTGAVAKFPARAAILSYLAVIALGTGLLSTPLCHAEGRTPFSFLDAAFTATSAVCVTGLTVRSTGHDLSFAGQLVVLVLIQSGGIGIMTFTTFGTLQLGRGYGLRERLAVANTLGSRPRDDLRWVLGNVLLIVVLLEGIGFALLALRNLADFPLGEALWHALFHSVSAFCNAGFALHDDSLVRYHDSYSVNAIVGSLIVVGGLGFPVLLDLRRRFLPGGAGSERLSLHTKIVLLGTALFLVLGAAAFLVLESENALAGRSWSQRIVVSVFQSITARTAGFNTLEIAGLTNATLFVLILLMTIGAGPCSTGGGFKVSTVVVLTLLAWAKFRGLKRVHFARRTVAAQTVEQSAAAVLVFAGIGILGLLGLLVIGQREMPHAAAAGVFLDASFEVVSALGTVGLSTGLTAELSEAGRVFLIGLMFVGRLGPLTVFVALSRSAAEQQIDYPSEDVLIG